VSPAVKGLSTIMNFSYVPYGNAREKKKSDGSWEFTCQHGTNECIGNTLMVCAMNYHPKPADYWPFVECLETASAIQSAGEKCATSAGFSDWSDINTCSTGKLGNTLQHAAAVATESLSPAHQWTPWVVMNGKPLSQSQLGQPLVKLVCDAYKGSDKPAACSSFSVDTCSADW